MRLSHRYVSMTTSGEVLLRLSHTLVTFGALTHLVPTGDGAGNKHLDAPSEGLSRKANDECCLSALMLPFIGLEPWLASV